ncbi:MAG: LLM class flavin-dependent oxidoreductase [Gammaproteobacteria bacterium]|nr:LLM class flavin-dependent oxidoreductase [Gammaproteobacteria bacterium]
MKEHGIMCPADMMSQSQLITYAQAAEGAGLDTIWVPELYGRDPFVTCALLLGATQRIRVGTAIANVYVRDARATKAAAYTLADSYGDRFDLGLGLSNKVGNVPRGHEWLAPLTKMNDFVDRYDTAELMFSHKDTQVCRYLAAHGPKLMTLAGARLDGAFTYLQTLAYSAEAKDRLAGKKLLLMQPSVFIEQPDQARDMARKAIAVYMPLTNYHRAWRERGFADADFQQGGSDPFIDALIAWGSVDRIRERYQAQRTQGVDHIIIIPVKLDMQSAAAWRTLEQLVQG